MQQGIFTAKLRTIICCGLSLTLSSILTSCDRIGGAVSGPPVPVIEIETNHFSMGEIESDVISEAFVKVFNRGESPLAITRVTTECPCTVGEMLEPVIPAGGEGLLRVKVDPLRISGTESTKTLILFSNDPKNPMTEVAISVVVKPSLVWEPENFDLGEVPQGQSGEARIRLRQVQNSPLRIMGGLRCRNRNFVGEIVEIPPEERVDPEKLEVDLIVRLRPDTPIGTHTSDLLVTAIMTRNGMVKLRAVAEVVPAIENDTTAAPKDE